MGKEMRNKKLPGNLVALIYLPKNSIYPEVTDRHIEGLKIDLKKMEWSLPESPDYHRRQPRKIGEFNYFAKESSTGVIGVYDKTNTNHLTTMVRDWKENADNKNRNWNDVD